MVNIPGRKKKHILITGSSGFLGRYLIKYSPSTNHILAHFRTKEPYPYGREVHFFRMDAADDQWDSLQDLEVDAIIHTAAMASIDECQVRPGLANMVNFEFTRSLCDFAAERNIRFIFTSSDVVFDGIKGFYQEKDAPVPQNVYAKTKIDAESYVLNNHPDAVVIRPSLFYGHALNGRPSFTEIMLKNLYQGKKVFLFTDQYRTPLLINNLSTAVWELVDHNFTGMLHIGGSEKISRMEMGELLCDMFNLDRNLLVPVKSKDARLVAKRPLDCSLNTDLARSILNTQFVDCRTGFNLAFH
ncbi:MAG: SDR family oxidoreductase [Calditrichia bacterium]